MYIYVYLFYIYYKYTIYVYSPWPPCQGRHGGFRQRGSERMMVKTWWKTPWFLGSKLWKQWFKSMFKLC